MLSRISLLTSKSNSYQLLKLTTTSSQHSSRLTQLVARRTFSGTQPDSTSQTSAEATPAAEAQQQKPVATKATQESQEDYNLDDVVPNGGTTEATAGTSQGQPQRGGERKKFQKREPGQYRREGAATQEGGLFKKGEGKEYYRQEPVVEKPPTFEEISATKSFQVQQELFNLIKNKIGGADKEKVQTFYSKIQQQLKDNGITTKQRLGDLNLEKIQALILEQRQVDEKQLYDKKIQEEESAQDLNSMVAPIEPEYRPLRFDAGDTMKKPQMTRWEYEDFINERLAEVQAETLLDEGPQYLMTTSGKGREEDVIEEEGAAEKEAETMEDQEVYDQFFKDLRQTMIYQGQNPSDEKMKFDFNKVTSDVARFNDAQELDQFNKERAQLKAYIDDDVDKFDDQYVDNMLKTWIHDKENEEEFEETWQGLTSDIFSNLREDLRSQYDQARTLMKLNQQLRTRLLHQTRATKQILQQTLRQKDKLVNRLQIQAKDFQSDVIPERVFDFIAHDRKIQARTAQGTRVQKKKNLAKQYLERKFDHSSTDIEAFNNELSLLLNHYHQITDKALRSDFANKMTYVVELLHKNQAQQNIQTKARLFEYAVISRNNDYANQMIKQIANDRSDYPFSLIDTTLLNKFFTRSIKGDNFNGLGHLMTYVEKFGVNIAEWNLSQFKTALDFYLNQRFNLNNVLIFSKYYTYFHQCRLSNELKQLDKPISQLSEAEKFAMNSRVFNQESLVDMRSLFGFLVKNLGTRQAIDPSSKDDALWKLVDFFTKQGIADIAQYSATGFNTLSDKDISAYLANRLTDTRAFEKTTQVLIRLKDKQGIHSDVIQSLKEYTAQASNGKLPRSFEADKVRQAYIRLRATQEAKGITLSEKNLEYFLYLFKSLEMWPEIVDLCENFEMLTGQSQDAASTNDIKNYYLSDSLLNMPARDHYYELIKKAVYNNQDPSGSAGYITAMTKAHFKDGAVDHALRFFESEVSKLRDVKQKREDFLITMFDSVYGEIQTADSQISYDEYKNRYLDMIQLSNNAIKESFAVDQLKRVIQGKNYEEIDTLFQLYLVQKQENIILSSLPEGYLSEIAETRLSDKVNSALRPEQIKDLQMLRERKAALQSMISAKDVEAINQLQSVMQNKKLSLFDDLNDKSADEIQKIFNIKSKEEIDEILKRTSRVQEAVKSLKDENTEFLESFHKQRYQAMSRAFKQNMDAMTNLKREVPDRNIDKSLDYVYKRKRSYPTQDYQGNAFDLDQFNRYMLENEIDDEGDPVTILAEAHDQTLADMKEQLLDAVNKRKSKILNITLGIFNKVQEQQIKSVKLSTVEEINPEEKISPKQVSESLQKYNILFNDPRSPIYSAIQTIAQYKGDKGLIPFGKIYRDLDDLMNNKIDIESLTREQQQLEAITEQVMKSQSSIKQIQSYLLKEQQEINKELTSVTGDYASWSSSKDRTLSKSLEKRIRQLYDEFKSASGSASSPENYTREDKLRLMRDVFSVEFGNQQFASNEAVFPSFYAQDLLIFGMENDIVEAVRLGEKMMSENGYTLSHELQKAVKDYMVTNAEKYHQAIKKTGPIDNTSLYRKVYSKTNGDAAPTIFCLDDPYWQDFVESNSRRTQQWRLPSHLAWNHKPFGIVGEVVDVQRVRDSHQQLSKYI